MKITLSAAKKALAAQLLRFGTIGSFAALVHFSVVVTLVSLTLMHPLFANIIAFLIAFQVSYFGHKYWTFDDIAQKAKTAWLKFFTVAVLSFLLNEFLFFILLTQTQLYYPIALLIVLMIVPPFTFILSKTWAFYDNRQIPVSAE